LEAEHSKDPGARKLQKKLAGEVTTMVHGEEAVDTALKAAKILYGKSTSEDIMALTESQFLQIFDGVTQATVNRADLDGGLGIIDALSAKTGFLKSNGEARRELKGNAISVNKSKVQEDYVITEKDLINDKMVLLSKGKKNNFILMVE
jgi:tyrosyl-tRNA synthetase